MVKRLALLTALLCGAAHAQGLVNNPGILPTATFTVGNCLQATGQNTVATAAGPCGTATGNGNVNGPSSSTIGDIAVFSNGTGTGISDSGVTAANLPMLGATQTWGGANTFNVRPVFNGATPWDSLNLVNPLTSAVAAATYVPFTGNSTITGNLTVSGIATSNTQIAVSNTPAIPRLIAFQTSGVNRWQLGALNNGEGGSNTGSDFVMFAYTDAGAVNFTPLNIQRSTGIASFSARPTFAGNLAWDAGNFNPSNFLTTALAATTYLTQTSAAATYTTPAEVNTALSTFLTIASANSTYLKIAGGGVGPLSNLTAGNSTVPTLQLVDGTSASQTNFFPSSVAGGFVSGPLQGSSIVQAGDASFLAARSGGVLPAFTIGVSAPTTTGSPGAIRIAATAGGNATIAMGVRPTFAGNTAWDSGNFNPAAGNGMPYDLSWTSPGIGVPTTPIPVSTVLFQYVFVRNITIPATFAGSTATARANATAVSNINVASSRFGLMGALKFNAGGSVGSFSVSGGPFAFQAGDTLTIETTGAQDATLNGISGTILAEISP